MKKYNSIISKSASKIVDLVENHPNENSIFIDYKTFTAKYLGKKDLSATKRYELIKRTNQYLNTLEVPIRIDTQHGKGVNVSINGYATQMHLLKRIMKVVTQTQTSIRRTSEVSLPHWRANIEVIDCIKYSMEQVIPFLAGKIQTSRSIPMKMKKLVIGDIQKLIPESTEVSNG